MTDSFDSNLGPLKTLAGTWEGIKGDDTAPSDDRGTETNKFKERITLVPINSVQNHEQTLRGLRYATTAWRLGETDPFHEELGYWLWDAQASQVMRCFMVPRGVSVIAGGTAKAGDTSFALSAELGSPTFGICSNPFLDREFKTVRYELKVTLINDDNFSYEEDTQILMKGRTEIFHHIDKNTLTRVI